MKRIYTGLAAAGALAVLVTSIATADTASRKDPTGDVKHNPPGKDSRYDIVRITYGHGSNGRLVQTVTTKGKIFGPASKSGPPPLLWIDVPGKVANRGGCNFSDYFVIPGEVDECGDGPKTGSASVKKVSAHTMRFSFAPSAIGSPARYGIAFVEEGSNSQGNGLVFFDRAPNKGFLRHTIK
jgi:hypothetical protein